MTTRMKWFYSPWIVLLLLIQQCFPYGQIQSFADEGLDPLGMDQAYLNISNTNYPEPILIKSNLVICEKCNFENLIAAPIPEKMSNSTIISTTYAYEFEVYGNSSSEPLLCIYNSYQFSEGGSYLLEIIQDQYNQTSCSIKPTTEIDHFHYWLPLIIALAVVLLLILSTQVWHYLTQCPRFVRLLPDAMQQGLAANDLTHSLPRSPNLITNDPSDDIISILVGSSEMTSIGTANRVPTSPISMTKPVPKRLRSLDAFRGFSLMVMIFVNYGGGQYWFFKHSVWNGLTVADLVFPWFTWMMGISIVLSQRSLRAKNVRKITIFLKICRRTLILFLLGMILQGGWNRFVFIRIFGVLQRLAVCYFFAAIIVLIFDDKEDEPYKVHWPSGDDVHQPLRTELSHTLFHFWPQWLFISLITVAWILITFIPKFEDCPRGYLGPGGKHDHGQYENCTGGIAGYIDRKILQPSHMLGHPTCTNIYGNKYPFDPEGLLGILTGTLLCYLGVHAGHCFAHSTSIGRVCGHWLLSSIICGAIGLILSKGGHSDSWIPINKNLWSLSFILILAALAFLILTILYLLVDVSKWFTGEPFLWLGMNSIVIYVAHEVCSKSFPIQFQVEKTTHAQLLTMHLYGVFFWTVIAGLMYRKKFFVAI